MTFKSSDLIYNNIEQVHIRACFEKVLRGYSPLYGHKIILQKKKLPNRTMQAQPILDRHFFDRNKRSYKVEYGIETKTDDRIRVSKLPNEVLVGWFAHEIGHLVDYQLRSTWSLIGLGIGYLFSQKIRKHAEFQADIYAIDFGFSKEILATKRFILNHSDIPHSYIRKISKYYMSPIEVEEYLKKKGESLLAMDDAIIF